MTDEQSVSPAALSIKDLLLEVYADMKVVRPAVQSLVDAHLPDRVAVLERQVGQHLIESKLPERVLTLELAARDQKTGWGAMFRLLGGGRTMILFGLASIGAVRSILDIATSLQGHP